MKAPFLVFGHDTVECAYFLSHQGKPQIDYQWLSMEKEKLKLDKTRTPKLIRLGSLEFLLHSYGTSSGYRYLIENSEFLISFNEYSSPSFFVKFKCRALWQHGLESLHRQFMDWTLTVGLKPDREESLSRVDFAFDLSLPSPDFSEDDFVSLSNKDSRYRNNRKTQTFQFGKSDIVLRVYNKVDEISESSEKTWFYDIWGTDEHVWRIEWQCRKEILKRFSIRSVSDLAVGQGDLLHYLAHEHDTLRVPNDDSNRSRWPLHPLWVELQNEISQLNHQGVYREIDPLKSLDERLMRIAISINGNLKQVAAIDCVKHDKQMTSVQEAFSLLQSKIKLAYDPLTWNLEVQKRINALRMKS